MGSCAHIVDDREILNQYEYDIWGKCCKTKINNKKTVSNLIDNIHQRRYVGQMQRI